MNLAQYAAQYPQEAQEVLEPPPQMAAPVEVPSVEPPRPPAELELVNIRKRRKVLKAQAKAIADELKRLDEEERALMRGQIDVGIIEALTFATDPGGLSELAELYEKHRANPIALGILYGGIVKLSAAAAGKFDLVELQELAAWRERIRNGL